ncbi:MAG: hypothetical protein U5N86_12150 [Planctomycetota bacterium]|nr:hypothetical protein [Planctomycetota bacterium]
MRYDILGIDLRNHYGQWMWSKKRAYVALENYKQYLKECEKTKESLEDYWRRTGENLELPLIEGWWQLTTSMNMTGISAIAEYVHGTHNNWLDTLNAGMSNQSYFDIIATQS